MTTGLEPECVKVHAVPEFSTHFGHKHVYRQDQGTMAVNSDLGLLAIFTPRSDLFTKEETYNKLRIPVGDVSVFTLPSQGHLTGVKELYSFTVKYNPVRPLNSTTTKTPWNIVSIAFARVGDNHAMLFNCLAHPDKVLVFNPLTGRHMKPLPWQDSQWDRNRMVAHGDVVAFFTSYNQGKPWGSTPNTVFVFKLHSKPGCKSIQWTPLHKVSGGLPRQYRGNDILFSGDGTKLAFEVSPGELPGRQLHIYRNVDQWQPGSLVTTAPIVRQSPRMFDATMKYTIIHYHGKWLYCHKRKSLDRKKNLLLPTVAGSPHALWKCRLPGTLPVAVPGLGIVIIDVDYGFPPAYDNARGTIKCLATLDEKTMFSMSACRVAWMVGVHKGLKWRLSHAPQPRFKKSKQ
jgi:hypothetical protein